jgi:hypothetical protein
MLAGCLIALFSFVALAVDLGMVAVARTDAQNAADVAALAGARTLNNKPGVSDNNRAAAITQAKNAVKANNDINSVYTDGEIQSVKAGQYSYNTTSQTFSVSYPTTLTSGSWTAMEVVVSVAQPTFFMKVWGVNSMPTGARAVAVHRPRDIALVIDMTGSMGYGTTAILNNRLNDPSTMWPQFSHYQRYTNYNTNNISGSETATTVSTRPNPFQQMGSYTSAPYIYAPANLTITTPNGNAVVRDFYYDTSNLGSWTTPVTSPNSANFKNAFHQWSPTESGANPSAYVGPTYTMTGYNAFDTTGTTGAMPAPDNFKTQSDSPITYVGDKSPRKSGSTSTGTWDPTNATGAAVNLAEYLGWTAKYSSGSTLPTAFNPATGGPTWTAGVGRSWANFRDATWERYGYDLDVANYVANRGTTWDPRWDWNTATGTWAHAKGTTEAWPTATWRPSVTAGKFKGYSMGPGYFGKTFVIWPPDPRTPVGSPGDTNYQPGDWRTRYFNTTGGADLTASTANGTLLTNGTGAMFKSSGYAIDYPAVLRWIKSGPMTLPPNLRSGHVLYYSSVPDTVTASGGDSAAVAADKVFWKAYIDFVLTNGTLAGTEGKGWPEGVTPAIGATPNTAYSYTWTPTYTPVTIAASPNGAKKLNSSTAVITTTAAHGLAVGDQVTIASVGVTGYNGTYTVTAVPTSTTFQYAKSTSLANSGGGTATKVPVPETITDPIPDMTYTDNPSRPRLHGWFGPMTMMLFLDNYNYWSGTTHQAQSWQLKAGVNSALDDIRNNHPNDYCGMAFFTTGSYLAPVVAIGQDYTTLKNSLFFPKSLLATIGSTNANAELRPYTSSGLSSHSGDIPNAQNSTDPVSGMAYAFNLLSPATQVNADATRRGRRGASKVVIFETDGIPNATQGVTLQKNGYNTYYTYNGSFSSATTATASTAAVNIAAQITKDTATNANSGVDSGFSLPNAPARVYAIGFGDIFSTSAGDTAKSFLLDIQKNGNTSSSTDTTIPSYQIITGPYQDRIDNLRTGLERILQGGVQVTLIE